MSVLVARDPLPAGDPVAGDAVAIEAEGASDWEGFLVLVAKDTLGDIDIGDTVA